MKTDAAGVEVAAVLWSALAEEDRSALRGEIETGLHTAGYPGVKVERIGPAIEADADPLRIIAGDRVLRAPMRVRARALSWALHQPIGPAHAGDAWRLRGADPVVCRAFCGAMAAQLLQARPDPMVTPEKVDAAVYVRIAASYLRELSLDHGDMSLASARAAAFSETGIDVERMAFEIAPDMPHGAFSFRIGGRELAPWTGLATGTGLDLDPGANGQPGAYDPMTGEVHAIVERKASEHGDSTSGFAYLGLALQATLREESWRLVSVELARRYAESIEPDARDVCALFRVRYAPHTLAQVLRLLLVESVSVRAVRTVLDAMLDYAEVPMQPPQLIVIDDRLPVATLSEYPDPRRLTAFVRTRLKRTLSNMYGAGGAISVYLLDSTLDHAVARGPANDPAVADALLRATAPIGMTHSGFEAAPPLLVRTEARTRVREILSELFPRWPVIAYQEIDSDLSITPLERLSAP